MVYKSKSRLNQLNVTMLSVLVLLSVLLVLPIQSYAASSITIDSPNDLETITEKTIRITGTYTDAYDIKLYINGQTQVDVITDDSDGDDSGSWFYDLDLDTTKYDGNITLNARGLDIGTRYGVWSSTITLSINNSKGNIPKVTILSPDDGETVNGNVPVKVKVNSKNQIEKVLVRINSGTWRMMKRTGNHYQYIWSPQKKVDKTYSIEAKAIDSNGNIGESLTTYAKVGKGTNENFELKKQDRAMWIWESESYKLLLNPNSRNVLDAFANDTETFDSDPVTTLYLAVGPYAGMDVIEDAPEKLRDFIKWAHNKGYQVHACISGGTSPPYMGAYEVYHDFAIREMERVINYNLASEDEEGFDGINVDIEPYISEDFKTKYPTLQIQYLDGLQKMINRRNVAGINLPFGPAIPKWYDTSEQTKEITWNGSTKWLSEHVQDISDYISIMDYRDTADGSAGIIAGAQGEMDYAEAIGKQNSVVVGVETLDIANSGDPEAITFREEGREYMEGELDKVYSAFGNNSYFGGIAVHHYDSIRTLPTFWGEEGIFWQPPDDFENPSVVSSPPIATTKNYHEINISFGMAYDDTEIDRYIVYRSTTKDFTPSPLNIAGLARGQSFTDVGLLPNTTYYYKVAAMDMSGKIGPVSIETNASTEKTSLKPMILTQMGISYQSTKANVSMKLIDMETKQPIPEARVDGRFTYAGGKYTSGIVDNNGMISLSSENIPNGHQIGFEPRRVIASGYYWASAYDQPHTTTLYPKSGLRDLRVSKGTIDFSTSKTSYSITVPNRVDTLTVTPTVVNEESIVTVNGIQVENGMVSQEIPLAEGGNRVSIIVTNRDGATDTYSIEVTKKMPLVNTIFATDDTFVFEHEPDRGFGSEKVLEVADISRSSGGGDRLAYLKFETSPFNQQIEKARLNVYVLESLANGLDMQLEGYQNGNWDENTLTWNTRNIGVAVPLGKVLVKEEGWYSFDVTQFVKNASGKVTFRIVDPNTKSVVLKLNSSENEENQPYLILNPK
ncbi:CBM96 family carbohydrate-binding protein [Bacillus timonensis]|uniref:CBM96 family carbohydrate-binding protein n=1 Tax=Bacillus timonensis TaxID=1033734 RepID=UPI0002893934|nr:DNRLRE domain-containing protein [Bacillus timonensis]